MFHNFSTVSSDDLNLQEGIAKGSLDFDSWTSLISEVEKTYPVSYASKLKNGFLSLPFLVGSITDNSVALLFILLFNELTYDS